MVPNPKAKSSSEITNLTLFTIIYHLGDSSRIFRTRWEYSRALASVLSQYTHFLLYFANTMVCLWNERHTLHEASDESSLWFRGVSWLKAAPQRGALLGVYADLPMPRGTQHSFKENGQKWTKHMEWTFLSPSIFFGFFDHSVTAWGIRTTNLICQESWAPKNRCFWTVVLEKTLESPLDCKEIKPVHAKGDWSWVFMGRTDVEAENTMLWPPDARSWLIWKDCDAGKDWGQEEKGMTEDEMVGWHHRLDTYGFAWTPGVGDGQGGLACCGSWDRKEWDMTDLLNWYWT